MYEVFLSFKNTDENGNATLDSRVAEDIYERLAAAGVEVFFSNLEIQRRVDREWEKLIERALDESRVMIVIGSRLDYVKSKWVEKEWRNFFRQRADGADKQMISVFEGFPLTSLPDAFGVIQNYRFREVRLAAERALGILGKELPQE